MASIVAELAGEIQSEQADVTASHHKIPSVTTANRPGEGGGTNAAVTAVVGMIIYNTTMGLLQQYNTNGWAAIDSPPTISSLNYPGDDTALDTVGEYTDATCDYNNDPTIAHDSNSNMKVGMSVSGTGIPADATIASVTSATAFELSASTTGGAVTNGTLTFNTQTLIISGSNFQTGVTVTIDGTAPSTVTRDSASQITVTGTPAKTAGTKLDGLVVTNTSGLGASINVDYSALPAWTTTSGNILSTFNSTTISTIDLVATGDAPITYAITTGALPGGLAMSTSTGDITGTISSATSTFNFTVTATDAEAQSSPRLFNIINNGTAPTGGTVGTFTGDGTFGTNGVNYRYHIFKITGTQTSTSGAYEAINFVTYSALDIEYIAAAGGGSGASVNGANGGGGGGGGAGGVLSNIQSYGGATINSLAAGTHTVRLGLAAAAQTSSSLNGHDGGNTLFINSSATTLFTCIGGGGGGDPYGGSGRNGGSGGGAAESDGTATGGYGVYPGSPFNNSVRQGYIGGATTVAASTAAGGGGWGAQGVNFTGGTTGSAGGAGNVSTIIPHAVASTNSVGEVISSQVYFAGGGGGGSDNLGGVSQGGTGGGGNGGHSDSHTTAGTAHTGSGGGAGGRMPVSGSSEPGGCGVMILRYVA
jgi:hypothetical protein